MSINQDDLMSYKLTIIKYPDGISLSELSRTVNEGSTTLGRAVSNDWVLEDPQRYLSSQHCVLSCTSHDCTLTDTSTNGTFVNHSHEPLGRENKTSLIDGDTFDLGEYTFKVEVLTSALGLDPYSQSPFSTSADKTPSIDDFDLGGSFPDPFNNDSVHLEDSFGLAEADPLVALDKSGQQSGYPFNASSLESSRQTADETFDTETPTNGESYHDGSDPLSQNVEWPQVSGAKLIPDNWDVMADDINSNPMENFTPPCAIASDAAFNDIAVSEISSASHISDTIEQVGEPASDLKQTSRTPRPGRVDARTAVRPQRVPRLQAESVSRTHLNGHIVSSMALDSDGLSDSKINEINDVAGSLLREVTNDMMQLLRSRANIKNEFRMNVTTIQPIENNPLKFSVGVDEALENMFFRKNDAYKDPNEAFAEGFEDIADHQIAIIAGIRFAYQHMIEQFNPAHLEKKFNKGKKSALLSGLQNARNWTVFEEYYSDLSDDMERSFHKLFGDNFVQAYEDQLQRLKAERGVKK